MKKLALLLVLHIATQLLNAQTAQGISFDKYGRACAQEDAYYYRLPADSTGLVRSFYISNDKPYFEGKLSVISLQNDNECVYSGTCTWFYRSGNVKQIKNFTANGQLEGKCTEYYESGKIWKDIEYRQGRIADGVYTEYDEDGTVNRIFEEQFDNNWNDWELYEGAESSASIAGGKFKLISFNSAGTSRYINRQMQGSEFTIEASITIPPKKEATTAGLIYGFKDWQNYHYFAIEEDGIHIGSYYEGIKTSYIDGLYTNNIKEGQENVLKIIATEEKQYFSVNGELQYKNNRSRLVGNNYGFVLSGKGEMIVDRFLIKEINAGRHMISLPTGEDHGVKATGSGLIVGGNGYIITNHHVVEGSTKIFVELKENGIAKTYPAEITIQDKDNDLAVIRVKDMAAPFPPPPYTLKTSGLPEVGSSVYTLGFPHALSGMGKEAKFSDGKVSSKTGFNGNINAFQTTIPVQPGNSGGPVFNTEGQLVGIVNATFREADNVSYVIKLNYVRNVLELLPEKIEMPVDSQFHSSTVEEQIRTLTNCVVLIKTK